MKSKKWFRRRNKRWYNLGMPKIRRIYPHLITHEIISIQPMTQEEFNNQIELRKARYSKTAKFGSILPSWLSPMIFDGNEFIPVKQFISWFGKDKIITKDRHYKKIRSIV